MDEVIEEVAKLREGYDILWRAMTEIIEAPGQSPNATVRRMAACAEGALINDPFSNVKPVPRFYKES